MIRDGLRFLRYNLQHYSLAVWGLRLRLDPDYPIVKRFLPSLISDSVFEYRSYALVAIWGAGLATLLPVPILSALVLLWAGVSFDRAKYYRSGLEFWRRALKENGTGHHRSQGRYMEQLLREIERRMKCGEEWQELAREATRLQDEVIERWGPGERSRGILAGK